MNISWHVMDCRSNRTLHAHEEVASYVNEVFTPFEVKFKKLTRLERKNKVKRKPEAIPVFGGYLFFSLNDDSDVTGLLHAIKHRSYLGKIFMQGDAVYEIDKGWMQNWMQDWGRGYDQRKDSRKNLQRIYGQKKLPDRPPAPKFKVGEALQFLSGGMQGLNCNLKSMNDDVASVETIISVSYTHLTLPTIYSV